MYIIILMMAKTIVNANGNNSKQTKPFCCVWQFGKKNYEWITYWSMLSVINRVKLVFISKLKLLVGILYDAKNKYYLSSLSQKKKKNQNLNLQMGSQITNERWRRCLLWIVITMTRKRVKVISSKNISWVIRSTKLSTYQHCQEVCGR